MNPDNPNFRTEEESSTIQGFKRQNERLTEQLAELKLTLERYEHECETIQEMKSQLADSQARCERYRKLNLEKMAAIKEFLACVEFDRAINCESWSFSFVRNQAALLRYTLVDDPEALDSSKAE